MRISTVREFRDKASGLLRSKDPILVTRRGRLAGIFLHLQKSSLPVELKHELFAMLTTDIARKIKRRGISEREVLADLENWRKGRLETRRRRYFFFSSRRRHTRFDCDWSSDVCSSD